LTDKQDRKTTKDWKVLKSSWVLIEENKLKNHRLQKAINIAYFIAYKFQFEIF